MLIRRKLVIALIVLAVIVAFVYALTALSGGRGDNDALWGLSGFLRSNNVKSDVTILVVGFASFIIGFGLRDVIGRRLRSMQTKQRQSKS